MDAPPGGEDGDRVADPHDRLAVQLAELLDQVQIVADKIGFASPVGRLAVVGPQLDHDHIGLETAGGLVG